MRHYRQLSSKFALLLAGLFLNNTCTKHRIMFPARKYFDGTVTMKTPLNWKGIVMPEAPLNDMHEKRPSILVGVANRGAVFVGIRYQPFAFINDVSTSEVVDLYYKSSKSMKLLSAITDNVENKIIIDYLGKRYSNPNKVFYLRHVLIIRDGKWVSFDFQGIDTKPYRDTVQQMTESIKILER